jgi:hypothetical protein
VKASHLKTTIMSNATAPKKLWNVLAECTGSSLKKARVKKSTLPSRSFPEKDLADAFAHYFIEKVASVKNCFKGTVCLSSSSHLKCDGCNDVINSVSSDQVHRLISQLPMKKSPLDLLPLDLIKRNVSVVELFTEIINSSFVSGIFPERLKHAVITPVIKKVGLDCEVLANFRPISNLSLLSKLMERVAASWLSRCLEDRKCLHPLQSAYRQYHSTETALLRVTSDWRKYLDGGGSVCVISLDVTAAFDTVEHDLLLSKLANAGVNGRALSWFGSYLKGRSVVVKAGAHVSKSHPLSSGVPQGSTLGPMLFNLYMSDLAHLLSRSSVKFHIYADDVLLYVGFSHSEIGATFSKLQEAIVMIEDWMMSNHLLLSASKTSAHVLHRPGKLLPTLPSLLLGGELLKISHSETFKWLGVVIDPVMSMRQFVENTCKGAYMHLRMIRLLRPSLNESITLLLCNSLVISRLDYCNSLLISADAVLLLKLKRVLHLAARTVAVSKRSDQISPILKKIGWNSMPVRPKVKIASLVYKNLVGKTPAYFSDDICLYAPNRSLRSSEAEFTTLELGSCRTKLGKGALSVAGPIVWNNLPEDLRILKGSSLHSFMNRLFMYFNE